ncbi:hypothetical protein ccbrp13_58960 [Ktedonobacteria bacterium brp13]|nr:hypothetical protein ccbrp13_58960 [Ktedonobacteria bacterium brp13]
MNFGSLAIKAVVVILLLFLLSLANAITFPNLAAVANNAGTGLTSILLFLAAILVLSIVGSLLGRGIRSLKKPFEVLILAFIGSFFLGGALALFEVLNVPNAIHVNLNWVGTNWYSPLLALLFIGAPLMLVFMIGD